MAGSLTFHPVFTDNVVLQQAPAQAAVYGIIDSVDLQSTDELAVTLHREGRTLQEVTARLTHSAQTRWDWLARLSPMADGHGVEHTLTATLRSSSGGVRAAASLRRVVFGDVWLCAGQSNMWLPLSHTFERNRSVASALRGKFQNIRLTCGNSEAVQLSSTKPTSMSAWADARECAASKLLEFCAVCWYFAEELTARFIGEGRPKPTLGLACVGAGGSTIEQWAPRQVLERSCRHTFQDGHGEAFDARIAPLVPMALKGWLWYQGEFNVRTNAVSGSSLGGFGYACELVAMVRHWRELWSSRPNSTAPLAPFGVVTLQPRAGWFGARDMGGMRHAQTGGYGVLPNEALPATFLAQGYDLPDPWNTDPSCFVWGCCRANAGTTYSEVKCAENTAAIGGPRACAPYCSALAGTPALTIGMGGLHSRNKRPLGSRLAAAAYRQVYGGEPAAALSGPTLSGCSVSSGSLVLRFNRSLLRSESVAVQDHLRVAGHEGSLLEVLPVGVPFCMQPMQRCPGAGELGCSYEQREWFCPRGLNGAEYDPASLLGVGLPDFHPLRGSRLAHQPLRPGGDEWEQAWISLNISAGASAYEVVADLTLLGPTARLAAVRFAWGEQVGHGERLCCAEGLDPLLGRSKPCASAACPIVASGGLPANPFLARVEDGRCRCVPPQVCDEGSS